MLPSVYEPALARPANKVVEVPDLNPFSTLIDTGYDEVANGKIDPLCQSRGAKNYLRAGCLQGKFDGNPDAVRYAAMM